MNVPLSSTKLKMNYVWPTNRLDTNAAFQTATQIMRRVGMDIDRLNRDCVLDISVVWPEGEHGKHFVPDYWVHWKKSKETVAVLEFLAPTMTVGSLNVNDPAYNLRQSVDIPHLRELLMSNITSKTMLQSLGLSDTNSIGSSTISTNN